MVVSVILNLLNSQVRFLLSKISAFIILQKSWIISWTYKCFNGCYVFNIPERFSNHIWTIIQFRHNYLGQSKHFLVCTNKRLFNFVINSCPMHISGISMASHLDRRAHRISHNADSIWDRRTLTCPQGWTMVYNIKAFVPLLGCTLPQSNLKCLNSFYNVIDIDEHKRPTY